MTRRAVAAAALGLTAVAAAGWWTVASRDRRPSILLVTIDTLRADHVGAYGASGVRTPTLDALAAGGIKFEAAYTTAPLTLPAHVSMLSGRLPAGHTVRTNDGYRVPDGVSLVGSRLQATGYRTAAFVGASVLRRETGIASGFDVFDDEMAGAAERRAGAVVDRASNWLRRPGDGPVFLWLHVYDPHLPYDPPAPYGSGGRLYDGEIEYVDANLASLLQQAEAHAGAGRLAVIVVADHGEGLGDHGEASHGALLYDETIRVPLIVRRPDGAAAGTTESRPVSTAGVAAAILQFAGTPVDGLMPSILDDTPALVVAESLYLQQQLGWSALYASRDARWKVIDAPTPERYNLAVDPGERRSLTLADGDATRDAVSRLRRTLAVAASGAPTVAAAAVDAEAARRLAALGYVSGGRVASGVTPVGGVNPVDRMAIWRDVEAALERAQAGARDEAAAVFTRVLAADPENVLALKYLGAYAIDQGELDRGIALNERVLATGLHVDDARKNLTLAYDRHGAALARAGRTDEAIASYRRLVAIDDGNLDARERLGALLHRRGDATAARQQFEFVLAREPQRRAPALSLAILLLEAGQIDEAARRLEPLTTGWDGAVQAQAFYREARRRLDARP